MSKKLIKLFIFLILTITFNIYLQASENIVQYHSDFENDETASHWSGWSQKPQKITYPFKEGLKDSRALKFSVREGWNVGILKLPNLVQIKKNSVLRFYFRGPSFVTLNITNATDGAWYTLQVKGERQGKWYKGEVYLNDAVYKKGGIPEVRKDGLENDYISKIDFACANPNMIIDDLEITIVDKPLKKKRLSAQKYTAKKFPELDKVFPYGVIIDMSREGSYGRMFGQKDEDRLNDTMFELKRNYLNAFANFVPPQSAAEYVNIAEKYGLYLVATNYSHLNVDQVSDKDKKIIKEASKSRSLLAWYGKDEPHDYLEYLKNKKKFDQLDPKHAYASAFTDLYAVKQLGPFMELVMVDTYDVRPGVKSADALLYHADIVRLAKEYCAGNKMWLVTQAFRKPWENNTWRYPHPEEIRFDIYNAVSAGVNGLFFFIYNGDASYLKRNFKGESFEYSLIDVWKNSSPVLDEIAAIGRKIVPVMPSMANAVETEDFKVSFSPSKNIIYGILSNKNGIFLIVVNKDLDHFVSTSVSLPGLKTERIYNLELLGEVNNEKGRGINIKLAPGDGDIFLITTADKWISVRKKILSRKFKMESELTKLEIESAKKAKLNVNMLIPEFKKALECAEKGTPAKALAQLASINASLESIKKSDKVFWSAKEKLDKIQKEFSRMHLQIRKLPSRPPDNQSWKKFSKKIIVLSSEYFALRRRWQNGDKNMILDDISKLEKNMQYVRKIGNNLKDPLGENSNNE